MEDYNDILKKIESGELKFETNQQVKPDESTVYFASVLMLLLPTVVTVLLGVLFSLKSAFVFLGLHSLGMFVHINVTSFTNAFIGREVNTKGDVFWKMFFLFIFTISFTLVYSL